MQTDTHDIIIVGGGVVGSALALALAQKTSLSIAILEVQAEIQPWSASHYHHRVSAMALSSRRIFQALHVWESMQKKRISPFTKIEVWDAHPHSEIQFDSRDIAEPVLGYIIENNAIQSALQEKLKHHTQIEYIAPITLTDCIKKENAVELVATNGKSFQSKLAIAADGAHSWLRQQVGIHMDKQDYAQEAIVATVHTALPHQNVARQIFIDTGPLAFLPLAESNASSIVWSLPTDEAKRLMTVDIDQFKEALARAFSHRLGEILSVGPRYSFPLYKQQAKNYVQPGIVLVGDAAHTVHPLAGQGVNMGLLDAACLVDVLVNAIEKRRDFASIANLRRYERWRRADNIALLAGVDTLKHLFASNSKSIQQLRSFGLNLTHQVRWLKNIFTRHAVGDRSGLPTLAAF